MLIYFNRLTSGIQHFDCRIIILMSLKLPQTRKLWLALLAKRRVLRAWQPPVLFSRSREISRASTVCYSCKPVLLAFYIEYFWQRGFNFASTIEQFVWFIFCSNYTYLTPLRRLCICKLLILIKYNLLYEL